MTPFHTLGGEEMLKDWKPTNVMCPGQGTFRQVCSQWTWSTQLQWLVTKDQEDRLAPQSVQQVLGVSAIRRENVALHEQVVTSFLEPYMGNKTKTYSPIAISSWLNTLTKIHLTHHHSKTMGIS